MGWLNNAELQKKLQQAESIVEVGAQYFHYKKPNFDPYTVKAIVMIEETQEPAVLYESTGAGGIQWVRTLENFTEIVEVDGVELRRFKKAE